jgi:hypothetical protein
MMAFVFIWLYLGSPAEPREAREFAANGVDFITDERLVKNIFIGSPSPRRAFNSLAEV